MSRWRNAPGCYERPNERFVEIGEVGDLVGDGPTCSRGCSVPLTRFERVEHSMKDARRSLEVGAQGAHPDGASPDLPSLPQGSAFLTEDAAEVCQGMSDI